MAKKVLLVDDDRNSVKFLAAVLTDNGYDVVTAHDGNEGLKQAKKELPDLIVLDVMMPKKSGLLLFQQLREEEQFKEIPVLMLTGVSGVLDDLERRHDDGLVADTLREALKRKIRQLRDDGLIRPEMFLDKPISPEVLIEKVQGLIGS